jgi:hypothetical protein
LKEPKGKQERKKERKKERTRTNEAIEKRKRRE